MKRLAGYKAAEFVEPNMIVGIGTGSTVHYFIEKLLERIQDGLTIQAIFSSKQSEHEAILGSLAPMKNEDMTEIDLTIDGADEIDKNFNMIKGGGGALFREKILASASKKMIVIVDESKCSKLLGKKKLPLEIISFGFNSVIKKLNDMGFIGTMRRDSHHDYYLTDNGNYIYDLSLDNAIANPKELHKELVAIPGIIETGLFFDVATSMIVANQDGTIKLIEKP